MTRASKRLFYVLTSTLCILIFILISSFRAQIPTETTDQGRLSPKSAAQHGAGISHATLTGKVVADKLGNETAKATLGRASWTHFHTLLARFPVTPSADESLALSSYIHLFARLYPCGECAAHFQNILKKFPPQVSGRNAAAAWGCHVHNEVNRDLGKEVFDCADIGEFYDCGCGDDERDGEGEKGGDRAQSGDGKQIPLDEESVPLQAGG